MSHALRRYAIGCGVLAGILAAGVAAQTPQVYRYVDGDGRVVYSDKVPPPGAKDVEVKKLGTNVIDSQPSLNTQMAQERYPVTLYTFACGDVCRNAEALLNRRGVPFQTINVSTPEGGERLTRLTGEMQAPVLQVGDKLIAKGFNETVWQSLLNEAGYPKTPPPRRAQPVRPTNEAAKADTPKPASKQVPGAGYPVN